MRLLWLLWLYAAVSPEQAALERISAESMRGNLSFLASDALEGRATPSRGLDIAAEFIASRFRAAGLEPIAGSYFQDASFVNVNQSMKGFRLRVAADGGELELPAGDVNVRSLKAIDVDNVPVVEFAGDDIQGKVVAGESAALARLRESRPALILLIHGAGRGGELSWQSDVAETEIPVIDIFSEGVEEALREKREMTISLHVEAPEVRQTKLENVLGLLRGSDETLRNEYVVVSAHYDHLGVQNGLVYDGANDNGSGVVSVIEMARALARMETHPKRSIVFAAFFGEEEGLFGSRYFVRHPPFPLKQTVANINLEQMGRTDEADGAEVGAYAFTGPSFSNLPSLMAAAARTQGVKIYNKRGANGFFDRSDNYPFAEAGVVAHTVVVAFEYPDYHAPGDKWEKIDYANMAKVDRAVAAGVVRIADAAERPKWSEIRETEAWRRPAR